MLRVLAPGGHLAVAVWDSIDNTPAYADELKLLERIAGSQAAMPYVRPTYLVIKRS